MSKTVNLAGLVIVSVLLLAGPTANAEIFTVELPDFLGPLVEQGTTKTASFDFGVSFIEINDVRLQLGGTSTPGLAHGDGIGSPEDEWIDVSGIIEFWMDPGDGVCVGAGTIYESSFVIEESLDLFAGATWDFLLDGADEVTLMFWWGSPIPEWPWVIVTDPTADVSEAQLIIEGVVPEPATVVLLGIGFVYIRQNKRKREHQL